MRLGHTQLALRSGAADVGAYLLGSRLLGNVTGTAALEVTFGGLELRARGDLLVCLTGATAPATGDGRPVPRAAPFEVRDGQDVVATATSPGTTITLGALTRGNTYTVVVAANNLLGRGSWSTPSPFSQPMFITDAPAARPSRTASAIRSQ